MPRRIPKRYLVIGLLVAVPIVIALAVPLVGARVVRGKAIPALAERLGRRVDVGAVRVGWGRAELDEIVVDGAGGPAPVRVPRAVIEFDLAPLLGGKVVVRRVLLRDPRIVVVRGDAADDNVSSILEKLRARREGGGGASGERRLVGPHLLQVEGGSLSIDDADLGTVEVKRLSAQLHRDGACHAELGDAQIKVLTGQTAQARSVAVDFTAAGGRPTGLPALTVSGGALAIWKGFTLTGITGGVTPDPADAGRLTVELRGGYGGVDRVLWDAKGQLRPSAREGDIQLNAARFDLAQLKPILVGTPVIDPELTEVDAKLQVSYRGDPQDAHHLDDAVDFIGSFHLSGLSVFHPMLGPQPVRHLGFEASARGQLKPRRGSVKVERAAVDFRGVQAILTAYLARTRKDKLTHDWNVDVRLQIPPVPCQTALAALPPELTPALQGFKVQGIFKTDINLALQATRTTGAPTVVPEIELGGLVGIDGCKVTQAPEMSSAERLIHDFEHAVEIAPGEWLTFIVGPDNLDFVPAAEISQHLINSIMTTEDSTFLRHKGFIPSEFRSALKSNLERGYFHLGASSITMQTVKNVLLSREKTLSRKLQELFLTWYVEKALTKERILEIYFNIVEFGPQLYGIGRAARHYFGKHPRDLTPREAAWFSSIMPNPKRRYVHFCRGAPDQKWENYLNRILKRMHERDRLTDEEYEKAMATRFTFNRAEALPEKECLELIRRLTTPPPGAQSRVPVDDESDHAEADAP